VQALNKDNKYFALVLVDFSMSVCSSVGERNVDLWNCFIYAFCVVSTTHVWSGLLYNRGWY